MNAHEYSLWTSANCTSCSMDSTAFLRYNYSWIKSVNFRPNILMLVSCHIIKESRSIIILFVIFMSLHSRPYFLLHGFDRISKLWLLYMICSVFALLLRNCLDHPVNIFFSVVCVPVFMRTFMILASNKNAQMTRPGPPQTSSPTTRPN
jgi:hypothetical protein